MRIRGRFALLCQHFYPELVSTGMHMTELATRLHSLGWDVTVVCAQPTLRLESENEKVARRGEFEGVAIRRVRAFGSHRNLVSRALFAATYLISTFFDVLRHRRRFDGLVVTTNPPFLGLVARLLRLLTRLDYVVVVYDVYPDILDPLGVMGRRSISFRMWDRGTRLFLRGAAKIVVIGRDMHQIVADKVPDRRDDIVVIPNWSDETHVRPVPGEVNEFRAAHADVGQFVVQYSGRMARTHNVEPLLEAASVLADRPVAFQFIGDGAKKRGLQERAGELGLTNTTFLPYQDRANLAAVLSAADIAVVCLDEPFTGMSVPSKAYGIMASGTPILGLVSKSSEIGLMVEDHECGVILQNATAAEVASRIESLLDDPGEVERLRKNALEAFAAHYSLAAAAERYDEVLGSCFAG